jgi:hypothetical protein
MVPRSGSFDCLQGAEVLFYPTAMDGIHKKKSNMAKPAWRLMSDEGSLQMAFMLQQQTVLV